MKRLALYLIPAEPVLSALRAAIHALAAQWSRTPFEPHLTLAICDPRDDAPTLLAALAKRHAPVARKLLTILNAILRSRTPWRAQNA